MEVNNVLSRFKLKISIILLIYLLVGVLLMKYYQYQLNEDGIIYIKIAKTYYAGNWYGAVESYHSPMISWLLIPFFLFGTTPSYALFATKLLSLITGFFTIIGISLLSTRFNLNDKIMIIVLVMMIPITLYFAYNTITPDILMVLFLVFYLYFIFDPKYSNKSSGAVFAGIFGALAYFSKGYAFIFILVHFITFNCLHYLRDNKNLRQISSNLLIGLSIFLILSGLWVGLISSKDGILRYSSAANINYKLVGPGAQGYVTPYLGESPVDLVEWSPFESWSNFKHQLNLLYNNIIKIINIINNFSYFALMIIIFYVLLVIRPLKEIFQKEEIIFPLATIIIYAGGFTPVLVEERYLWVVYLLLLLMGAFLLTLLFKNDFFTPTRKTVLATIFIVSFLIMPVGHLIETVNIDKDVYLLSESVSVNPHSKIASNNEWLKSSYLAYYWNSEYIGQTKPTLNPTEQIETLKSHGIDYYLVWGDANENIELLSQFKEVNTGKIPGLRVFALKNQV